MTSDIFMHLEDFEPIYTGEEIEKEMARIAKEESERMKVINERDTEKKYGRKKC